LLTKLARIVKAPTGWVLCILLICAQSSLAREQRQSELKDIQQQIQQRQEKIEQQLERAKQLQLQLKKAEVKIANSAKALNHTQIGLENTRAEQIQLSKQQTKLQQQRKQQQSLLAKQINSAFMAGQHDYAKMLLNQQDAGKFERTITYYQYLNKARLQQIEKVQLLVKQLQQVNEQLLNKQQQLQKLEQQQLQQKSELAAQQKERQGTLQLIEKNIDTEAARIEQLQINEQSLLKALELAQKQVSQQSVTLLGLAGYKGKLIKPTQGKVRNLFGTKRQGQVHWKGILISGNEGSSVRAIHNGKVLYSDWLRGFGLVAVVDHGEGYMSLYGHNQALVKQAGDSVDAGETIALVGQSGGQSSPNLYFEIRHKGVPIDPRDWLQK
jgi:septal ring factor EnvC (AmiA/AmiB activator)